ncbi:putative disease resistance RPP13-like protein 1 [Cornus florida]|uniref:putative disease resistance RPP13-like protein 1 n=1 Tax=Cornus florida TaxID=4283 RepID=UPI0028A05E85|nr:putative disease resistance RPP13-like protein 1 [Cornus florida]XP_059643624.1 putative disease resistance RPP13-like protein 1 [Cornus florida]
MAIGEIFLSAFIQVLFHKLASPKLLKFARREGIHTKLTKLSDTLMIIQAVIGDAEEKQITDKAVKIWLERLNELAYDLDDLLDQFATEALRRELMDQKPHASTSSKVQKFIPICFTGFPTPGAFMFDYNMRSKIEDINARLQAIVALKNDLGLEKSAGGVRERLPPPAWANKSDVYGREKDKEAILELLLRDETSHKEISVIPIVGMGGVGKTTLAQLLYDDDSLKGHFDLKPWAYVSDDFDFFKVTKTVLESATSIVWNFEDQNKLTTELKEFLSGKKFLLILDDIWNENPEECDKLLSPFSVGAPGSKIIITTRSDNVASIMGTVPAVYLKGLNDDDCLSLFAQNALRRRNFDAHPELEEVAKRIVKKCNGLPLAAKTLGGLLRNKFRQDEWEDILNSNIWELPQGRSNILPALRVSYHHLPSHLKRCFAYCSIFPKGYEFDKDEVILLWMAEGLLQLSERKKRKEDFGRECFDGLLSMSFFQQSSGNKTGFVMHDILNELAQFFAGEICFRLLDKFEGNEQYTIPTCARHLSYTHRTYQVFQKFRALYQVNHLRTFLPLSENGSHGQPISYLSHKVLFDLLPKLQCLRVLSLSGYHISKLPDSIDNLKQLRYLNLSYTSIKWLPQSLGTLCNLETLLLRNCGRLCMLPPSIVNLISMRHLDNAGTKLLQEMPLGIGKLTNLQTLSKIIVGKGNGLRLTELKDLLYLRGMLSIVKLENVMGVQEAMDANLVGRQHLDELVLAWSQELDDSRNENFEMDVLCKLQPHRNLKKLKVEFYGGMSFPRWIGDPTFSKMVNLSLSCCSRCKSLPPVGQLPLLKDLFVGGMHGVKSIGAEFCKYDCPSEFPAFQSLERLTFEDMPEWEEWCFFNNGPEEEATGEFPHLRVLTIRKCPKLRRVSILKLPSLCKLHLQECDEVVLKSFTDLNSLITFKVTSVAGLSKLPEELMQFLAALDFLEFNKCEQLVTLWENGFTLDDEDISPVPFCKLRTLKILHCANLEKLPSGLNNLTSLEWLTVIGCPKLVCFPENGVPSKLSGLWLEVCEGLKSIPDGISHLEFLFVLNCSSLSSWPTNMFPTILKHIIIDNCMQLGWVSETMVCESSSSSSMSALETIIIKNWTNMGRLVGYLNHFANLKLLSIHNCDSLECFPERGLSIPNLRKLIIHNCVNLRSLPPFDQIQNLSILLLRHCPNVELFGNGNLPPKLVEILVDGDYGKPSLSEWGLHRLTSLEKFCIFGGLSEMVRFPDNDEEEYLCVFPPSLTQLFIGNLPNVESISSKGLRNLTSLQHLILLNCPKLESLSKEGLPSTLQRLEIVLCPKLKDRCKKGRGDYEHIIADIPCVEIDNRYIYEEE